MGTILERDCVIAGRGPAGMVPGERFLALPVTRVRENAAAAQVALSADERADLDGLARRVGVHGDRYDAAHMGYVNR